MFHNKISTSYAHISDLMPEKNKFFGATIINGFDSSCLLIIALFLKFYTRDLDFILRLYFYFGTISVIIYLILIPESPKWLFIKEGSSSKSAISVLNYIFA